MNQCGDRLWRRGQKYPVFIEIAIARGTIDQIKWDSVTGKGEHHKLFLEHLAGDDKTTQTKEEERE